MGALLLVFVCLQIVAFRKEKLVNEEVYRSKRGVEINLVTQRSWRENL